MDKVIARYNFLRTANHPVTKDILAAFMEKRWQFIEPLDIGSIASILGKKVSDIVVMWLIRLVNRIPTCLQRQ